MSDKNSMPQVIWRISTNFLLFKNVAFEQRNHSIQDDVTREGKDLEKRTYERNKGVKNVTNFTYKTSRNVKRL